MYAECKPLAASHTVVLICNVMYLLSAHGSKYVNTFCVCVCVCLDKLAKGADVIAEN